MKEPSRAIKGSFLLVWLLVFLPALQARGPEGGSVLSMAISPSDPDIIYVGSWLGGVFRSTDGGEHWEAKDRGFSTREGVSSLLVDPADPNTVYASAPSGFPFPQ